MRDGESRRGTSTVDIVLRYVPRHWVRNGSGRTTIHCWSCRLCWWSVELINVSADSATLCAISAL